MTAPPAAAVAAPADPVVWADPAREAAFGLWLARLAPSHRLQIASLRSASSDASFRRYFRIDADADADADPEAGRSFIVMDAPPPQEDVAPFIDIAQRLARAGLNAPQVLDADLPHGFLLLTDLGSNLYLDALDQAVARADSARVQTLMRDAINALVRWQSRGDAAGLPAYDEPLLRRELALFPQWCVQAELGVTWSAPDNAVWNEACDLLVHSALAQPRVVVHRDFMPRNLMVCGSDAAHDRLASPGILDFQDAVHGPIAYDIACLLRDAFISWDEDQELDWAVRYWERARQAGLPVAPDFAEFWRQLEWMGLQRHLKVLGIFCRLKHRDAKPRYSADLPRFFGYAHKVAARYNALRPLSRLLEPLMGAPRIEVYR